MTVQRPEPTSSFGAADTTYLREQQYRTPDKLNSRIQLHTKYGTSRINWFDWLQSNVEWDSFRDVLEVGCGTGHFWSALPVGAGRNLCLTISDLSSLMVEETVERARINVELVTGVEADVQSLPFGNKSFDFVIANQMLYHSPEPIRALAEIRRVLRPDGTLLAATIGPMHLTELFDIESAVLGVSRRTKHADVFGSISGRPLLEQNFVDVRWLPFVDGLRCTDVSDVVAHLVSIGPAETATDDERTLLREEVEHRIRLGDGVLTVTKDVGVFIAQKADPK
jgi:SAM-dependent methyltransferase